MEKTYLSEVYESFLSTIFDYSLAELTADELENDLYGYFKKAKSRFRKCRNRLDLLEDELGEKYFGYVDEETKKTVEVTLDQFEIDILAHCMLIEYLKPQIFSSETLKQSLSDKDFKIYSQANQLRELNLLYRLVQKEANKMITDYTYIGMTDNDRK